MRVVTDPAGLSASRGCAFVPTMGALHEGHASLLRQAKQSGLPVVVSIYVNPTQFGPQEDLARYPRTLEADLRLAESHGVDVAFAPATEVVYPDGIDAANAHAATLPLPEVATAPGLEDRSRPGHFAGVQLVVARLFDLVAPRVAVFGEKDWQQLRLIEEMVRRAQETEPRRWPDLSIVRAPTVRDADGLALSSRNRYLTPEDRKRALALVQALRRAAASDTVASAELAMQATLREHGLDIDYAVVRDAQSLGCVTMTAPTRALIAARLRSGHALVRLIDNMAMPMRR